MTRSVTAPEDVDHAAWINLTAGGWLVISPWVLGFENDGPLWSDLALGSLVLLLSAVRLLAARRNRWISVGNAVAGAWVFASGLWLYGGSAATWSNLTTGLVIAMCAVWSIAATGESQRAIDRRIGRRLLRP